MRNLSFDEFVVIFHSSSYPLELVELGRYYLNYLKGAYHNPSYTPSGLMHALIYAEYNKQIMLLQEALDI